MFDGLYEEHKQRKAAVRKEIDENQDRAVEAVGPLATQLQGLLNSGVQEAFGKQREINHEVKELEANAEAFARQTRQWAGAVDGLCGALKELGDVENWLQAIAWDMRGIERGLAEISAAKEGQSAGGGSARGVGSGSVTPPRPAR